MNDNSNLVRYGVVGVVTALAIVLATLQYDRLPFIRSGIAYTANFADAGGLLPGDRVEVSGIKVGTVEEIELDGPKVLVRFTIDDGVQLGDKTAAAIKTNTILGRKSLEVTPSGDGSITAADTIPLDRTTSPYSLNDALGDLAGTVQDLDTNQLDKTLDALADTLRDTPEPLRAALDGVSRLSKSLNARDDAIKELLAKAQGVTKILADRGDQINALLLDGNQLLGELERRRNSISELIVNLSAVSQQLSGLVHDNEAQLKPSFDKLNSVLAVLEKHKEDIAGALDGLGPYAAALGEAVGSGPYFQAYVANASSPLLRPLVDALVWPSQLPQSLLDYLTPPPSIELHQPSGVPPR